MIMGRLATVLIAALLIASAVGAQEFKIDAVHSGVNFAIKHMMVSNTTGSFPTFTGSWKYNAKTKKIEAFTGEVDVASVDTNSKKRDVHLRNADFFDTDEHPKAKFELLKHHGDRLIAKVTIKGITKPVEFKIKISKVVDHPMKKGLKLQGITMVGVIKRLDFKVGSDYANKVLGTDVAMTIELEGHAK
jgi:polyisoprenoid-binding protein YceI